MMRACQRAVKSDFAVAIQTKRRRANSDTVARKTSDWMDLYTGPVASDAEVIGQTFAANCDNG